ncbi:hypothetical protein [Jeotgalibacillus haloalkalitolerans]|uniref:Uncharacterized protein n=1 Tax=Jeotgalibacillus haloalkalitolerans TaxID=3104292 RepID=A0ABU5KMA3_9BACL|nr:hypothetical protein [Jeotgalibacillus sp. HH7-29]MDZ5712274.1 hypothetical protein [Jeotgalibacillus sp. HH7-29]
MPMQVLSDEEAREFLAKRGHMTREGAATAIATGESVEYMHKGQWIEINPYRETISVLLYAASFRLKPQE